MNYLMRQHDVTLLLALRESLEDLTLLAQDNLIFFTESALVDDLQSS
jgi:hypothetical protein